MHPVWKATRGQLSGLPQAGQRFKKCQAPFRQRDGYPVNLCEGLSFLCHCFGSCRMAGSDMVERCQEPAGVLSTSANAPPIPIDDSSGPGPKVNMRSVEVPVHKVGWSRVFWLRFREKGEQAASLSTQNRPIKA